MPMKAEDGKFYVAEMGGRTSFKDGQIIATMLDLKKLSDAAEKENVLSESQT